MRTTLITHMVRGRFLVERIGRSGGTDPQRARRARRTTVLSLLVVTAMAAWWSGGATAAEGQTVEQALATAATRLSDGAILVVGMSGASLFEATSADAWHSTDGTNWMPATLTDDDGIWAYGAAASDSLVVAVGGTALVGEGHPAKGFIWTSPDGDAWTLVSTIDDARLRSVISTPDGFLATGQMVKYKKSKFQQTPTLWSSNDGTTWTATTLPGKGDAGPIAQGAGSVTIVVETDIDGPGSGPGLLRSTDGATWERLPYPTDAASPKLVSPGGLGTSADRFVAGSVVTAVNKGSVWTSTDGATWTNAVDVPGPISAVASGTSPSAFGQGNEAVSGTAGTWSVIPRPENGAAVAAVPWSDDGTTLVVTDDVSSPSFSVEVVPPAAAGAPSTGAVPSGSTAPSGQVAAPSDPLCDPYLTAAQTESITGSPVLAVQGSAQEDMGVVASCHWTTTDGFTYVLTVETNMIGDRSELAKRRDGGQKVAGLPKGQVANGPDGGVYVIWGPSGKDAYILGGDADESVLVALAKAVTPQ